MSEQHFLDKKLIELFKSLQAMNGIDDSKSIQPGSLVQIGERGDVPVFGMVKKIEQRDFDGSLRDYVWVVAPHGAQFRSHWLRVDKVFPPEGDHDTWTYKED